MPTSHFTPGPGGVMTEEVGVVTGELTLHTDVDDRGACVLRVQYRDAAEWYVVESGRHRLEDAGDAEAFHEAAVALLARGGQDAAQLTRA